MEQFSWGDSGKALQGFLQDLREALGTPKEALWNYAKAVQPVLLGRLDPTQPTRGAVSDGPLLSEGPLWFGGFRV